MKRRAVAAVMFGFAGVQLLWSGSASANFVDNWISQSGQTASTDPSYLQGAQRGYFNGGSLSARWPQSTDNLMTVSMPSIKSGCGGIDMFMGGFSFMNMDYLVQKLQRILAAAPAAAFDLALKTLTPQVSETIKSLEAIADKLNNLQMDDCKAAKALVATIADPNDMNATMSAAKTDFMVSSGLGDDWKGSIDNLKNSVTKMFTSGAPSAPPVQQAANGAVQGCPAPLLNLFQSGSLLDNIASAKGIDPDQVAIIRGFIGDVMIFTPNDTGSDYMTSVVPPCGNTTFQSLVDGTAQIRATATADCTALPDQNRNLVNYSYQHMMNIANAMRNNGVATSADIGFMNEISAVIPAWPAIRAGVRTNTESAVVGQLSDLAAKALAYQMFLDMQQRINEMQGWVDHMKSTQKTAAPGSDPSTCQIDTFKPAYIALDGLKQQANAASREAYRYVVAAANDYSAVASVVNNLGKFDNITKQQLAAGYGRGVAGRATQH